jgi:drug/metabolite transporter (DMT)-like permease
MWIAFSLLAALSWTCVNIVDKYIISKRLPNYLMAAFLMSVIDSTVGLALFFILRINFSYQLLWGLLVGMGIPITDMLYFKSIKDHEVSRVIPWFQFSILLVALGGAIFLNEILTLAQYGGIILLFIGLVLLTAKRGFKFSIDKWVPLIILASVIYAATTLMEKHLLAGINPFHLYSFMLMGSFLGFLPFLLFNLSKITSDLKKQKNLIISIIKPLCLSGFFGVSAMLLTIMALNLGRATLVAVLLSFQYIFLLILTILISLFYPAIIKEETDKETIGLKIIALLAVIIGIYLVSA